MVFHRQEPPKAPKPPRRSNQIRPLPPRICPGAAGSCGQMNDAHSIFSFCNSRSTFLYNTLIRGHSSVKQFHLSLSVFAQMVAAGKAIDCDTPRPCLNQLLASRRSASAGGSTPPFLLNGFAFDAANCNALIIVYAKSGDLLSARKVFEVMPVRNTVSWCALIGGYGMHGSFFEACELFERMMELGCYPDEAAFTTVLAACSHGGFVEEGREYFEMMRKRFGIRPNMVHYTCMVDTCARAGRIEEAKEVIESMGIEPDEAILRALYGPSNVLADRLKVPNAAAMSPGRC